MPKGQERTPAQLAALKSNSFKPKSGGMVYVQATDRLSVAEHLNETWKAYKSQWSNCTKCPLGHTADNHVLVRGRLPCDILFVGEAPGKMEDAIGHPFVGPSGKLLNRILVEVDSKLYPEDSTTLSYAIANIVCCIPCDDDEKVRPPVDLEAASCKPHLTDLLSMATPKGIVLLGQVAKRFFTLETEIPVRELYHPAYLLRRGGHGTPECKDVTNSIVQFCRKLGLHQPH